jgi:hypothetical protein
MPVSEHTNATPRTIEDAVALANQRLAAADLSQKSRHGRVTNRQLVFATADVLRKRIANGEDAAQIAEILASVSGDQLTRETLLSYLREHQRAQNGGKEVIDGGLTEGKIKPRIGQFVPPPSGHVAAGSSVAGTKVPAIGNDGAILPKRTEIPTQSAKTPSPTYKPVL